MTAGYFSGASYNFSLAYWYEQEGVSLGSGANILNSDFKKVNKKSFLFKVLGLSISFINGT